MKTRKNNWFDESDMTEKLGIDVYHENKWKHLSSSGIAFFADSEEEREAKRRELRRRTNEKEY